MKADLHMHTNLSDGRLSPKEVIQRAKDNNVDIIAITDHDICVNVEEHVAFAESLGLTLIPAIELSTIYQNKPVHILGYFKDDSYNKTEIITYFSTIREGRQQRAKQFIKNLKDFFNIEITYEEVLANSSGIIARPHIAKAIIKNYKEYTINRVFDELIGDNSKAYVPSCEISVQEGIDLLRRHNCVVVLAHPVLLKDSIREEVLNFQYDGVEAIYYLNKKEDEEQYISLMKQHNLIYTAGSDYHGIPNDKKHGDIGDCTITGKALESFMNFYKN